MDGIDLSREGPVGNGAVTCFTVYSGPSFDYGTGAKGKALFVDCTDAAVLGEFREFFEDPAKRKVAACVASSLDGESRRLVAERPRTQSRSGTTTASTATCWRTWASS